MLPKKFDRNNFTAARAASMFSCAVWFHPDQEHGQYFHSWQDDLYKLKHGNGKTIYIVSHSRGLKSLMKMLDNFCDPLHKLYKSEGFMRAEIYENFGGNIVHARTMTAELQDSSYLVPEFATRIMLQPGVKHRLLHALKSETQGVFPIHQELITDVLQSNWKYWNANSRYSEQKKIAA